jgi:putative DNA primase/helicase
MKPSRTITPELIRTALACIPPDLPRDEWARVAMAIRSELGAEGFDLFDTWSQGSERYNASATKETWRSIKAGGRVTIGTLFHIAKGYGFKWDDSPTTARPDPATLKAQAEARKARDEAERKATQSKHSKAAHQAAELWAQASETEQALYLERKGVQAFGVRIETGGGLLVPMVDEHGALWNVQRIAAQRPDDGPDKRFLSGGRKSGLMHWIGQPQGAGVLLLAEGYATGASLHQATGHPVCVAFDAGNLPTVAKAVRATHPAALILVCGDNDQATSSTTGRNPGKEKAEQAARAVRGVATWPEDLPPDQSDFNDLHQLHGLDAVRGRVDEAIKRMQATKNKPDQGKASERPDNVPGPVWDRFQVIDDGVFFLEQDQDGRTKAPQWVCSRLDVTARTRDEDGQGWGMLLEFPDPVGHVKTWAMPARMLAGDGAEYRAALLSMGLRIASGVNARNRLGQYLQTRQPQEMARCADRVGWHGRAYVLPRETIGGEGERIVYQVDGITENPFKQRGTVEAWRDGMAALCVGNDRLLFAVACALAGPLVRPSGVDSGGFHLRGSSSCGKTTALKVAASVWGGPSFMQRWRSTDNALEAIAAQHCDGLLILDELAQVDPKTAGECAYMLANETGKARSTRTGQARNRLTWRLLFLSAGEISLSQHMAEGGKRSKAGQELRMADVPADAGVGRGIFNELHDLPSGAALSAHLGKLAEAQHGMVGRAFLEWLVERADTLRERTRAAIEQHAADWIPEAASGQVQRVGRRFALVAVAGELATEAGLTGWPVGEAARGVRACFEAWMAARGGTGDAEVRNMLAQVQRLMSERGAANFAWMNRLMDDRAPNPTERWGVRRLLDSQGKPIKRSSGASESREYAEALEVIDGDETTIEYFVFPEVFRSKLCEGFDHNAVAHLLAKRGHLVTESGGRLDRSERIPGMSKAVRVYRIKSSLFEDELAID